MQSVARIATTGPGAVPDSIRDAAKAVREREKQQQLETQQQLARESKREIEQQVAKNMAAWESDDSDTVVNKLCDEWPALMAVTSAFDEGSRLIGAQRLLRNFLGGDSPIEATPAGAHALCRLRYVLGGN
jgi:hypothetical protein